MHIAIVQTVGSEEAVRQAINRGHSLGEQQPVKARIVVRGEAEQLLLRIASACQDRVDIYVVTHLGASEQGTDFIRHGVVHTNYGSYIIYPGVILPPTRT